MKSLSRAPLILEGRLWMPDTVAMPGNPQVCTMTRWSRSSWQCLSTGPIRAWGPILIAILGLLGGCRDSEPTQTPTPPPLSELVFLGFADDMPQAILDAFAEDYGIGVRYVGYQSPEDGAERIRSGDDYDLAVIENQLVPPLIEEGRLAKIDFGNVTNFENVSAAFRDLAIDPGNRHSVPFCYGTTGLLVRTDLVGEGVQGWSDLWDPRYAGRIGLRAQPREVVGLTLVSLGHAFNSEDPQALAAALQRLMQLRDSVTILDYETSEAVPKLLRGEIAILHGYAEDYRTARAADPAVVYVLPREGSALWEDSFVISAKSQRKPMAEVLLDFLLRGDIAARYINEKRYANANDAALPLIDPAIRNDPVVYPPMAHLRGAHIVLPLSPEGERRYADLWARFVAAGPEEAP